MGGAYYDGQSSKLFVMQDTPDSNAVDMVETSTFFLHRSNTSGLSLMCVSMVTMRRCIFVASSQRSDPAKVDLDQLSDGRICDRRSEMEWLV